MEVLRCLAYTLAVVIGVLWLQRQNRKRRYDLQSMPGIVVATATRLNKWE